MDGKDSCAASEPDVPEELAVAAGAFLWTSHPGQHVLLHHDPASIPAPPELRGDALEVHVAFAELAEDAVLDRLHRIPALAPRPGGDFRIVVLEVDVPDPVGMPPHALDRVAPSEPVMAGAEAEPEHLAIGHGQEPGGLLRRLHPGADVMVEDGAQPGLLLHGPGDPIRAVGERAPLRLVHSVLGKDPP